MARPKAKRVKRVLNVVPSPKTERDWRMEHADQAGLLAAARVAERVVVACRAEGVLARVLEGPDGLRVEPDGPAR